jgi:phosphoenolpyruvate-protein kinase (PTS system EI component)
MAQETRSSAVLFSESLSANQIRHLLDLTLPAAIILRTGSLADHLAVLLNGKGSQLIIAPELVIPSQHRFILIDGVKEEIIFSNDETYLQAILDTHLSSRQYPEILAPPILNKSNSVNSAAIHVDGTSPEELSFGLKEGATGIGILRTEWIGWQNHSVPTLEEHLQTYQEAQIRTRPHSLNIRLFDIGGDKVPKWARIHSSLLRSSLGYRGIRAARWFPKAFSSQLDAISMLARGCQVGVVIPMVTDLSDIDYVREQINMRTDRESRANITIGAMVEIPSAALMIRTLLPYIDFVRIGPGDLTQFTLATERSNLQLSDFSSKTIHKAVLQLIRESATACGEFGKSLSMCLDLEPRNELLKELLAAGVNTFCVSSHLVKSMNRRITEVFYSEQ